MSDEDKNSTEVNSGETTGDSEHLEIVRIKNRTIHVSPISRKKQEDYIFQNTTGEDKPIVNIPLPEFKRDLKVTDEDGTILSDYPSRIASESLAEIEEAGEQDSAQAAEISDRVRNSVLVQFPPSKPIGSGDLRTVRLDYEQSDQVRFRNLSDVFRGPNHPLPESRFRRSRYFMASLKYFFFDIPYFLAEAERSPDETHDVFIIVVGTPGYKALGESNWNGEDVEETTGHDRYENGIDDSTRNLSIRLPAPEADDYEYQIEYELIPSNKVLLLSLEVYWVSVVAAGLISIHFALVGPPSWIVTIGWIQGFNGLQTVFSAGVVSGTLGIMFALQERWADRYRILCTAIIALHTVAWVFWTNSGVSFP